MPSPVAIALAAQSCTSPEGHHQIEGFDLTGVGESFTETGTIPVVGSPCMGNPGHGGVWTGVEQLEGGAGGQYVNYGTIQVLLQ